MPDHSVITAEAMASAALNDPQFHVPARPRLRRGLSLHHTPEALVVEGTPKKQLLRGAAARELLPRMLPLLDGSRGHKDVADALDIPAGTVFKALSLLWTCGLIEEAASPQLASRAATVPEPLADFLSRIGDSTGANHAWEEALDRLARARVEVFGTGPLADAARRHLAGSLVDTATGTGTEPAPGSTLVVAAGPDPDASAALAASCALAGVPLIRLALTGRTAHLGPYVDLAFTPCLACRTAEDPTDDRPPLPGDAELAAALFARDLFALLSRSTPSPLPSQWRTVDLADLSQQRRSAATRPGCPNCSAAPGDPVAPPLAARYEAAIAFPPREYADGKAHQAHYKPSNIALQNDEKTWPVAAAVPLPAPPLESLRSPRSAALDDRTAALLLAVTAGRRGLLPGRVQRWTASGGNIGSVVAHLVVRDVPGLEPGVYGYVASEHRLAKLAADPGAVPGEAPLTVVLTGDFTKVAKKYAAFALRIVLLDAGCATATLRAAASALDLPFAIRTRWDDLAVAAALGVDPDLEPITAVVDLGGAP
ncbi:tpaE [Streptomyces sp. P9(2023)]|uniref:tpaE n=1 Tax=Streptomyces sp. P9(2023) TaxID=3064394 RepID=UPI0028F3F648|nr:tpaE [Streptomyces sp. P9(2023)]MDT9689110.1 tpaE [Streptomyces sp. P9(2023)]